VQRNRNPPGRTGSSSQSEWHGFHEFGSETDLVEKLDQTDESAKGCDGFRSGADLDWFVLETPSLHRGSDGGG